MASRLISPLLALGVGVGSGIWIFSALHPFLALLTICDLIALFLTLFRSRSEPLLQSYAASTEGTFKPEDDHHSAPVPNLPFTDLKPAKDPEGRDLLKAPKDELPTEGTKRKV